MTHGHVASFLSKRLIGGRSKALCAQFGGMEGTARRVLTWGWGRGSAIQGSGIGIGNFEFWDRDREKLGPAQPWGDGFVKFTVGHVMGPER